MGTAPLQSRRFVLGQNTCLPVFRLGTFRGFFGPCAAAATLILALMDAAEALDVARVFFALSPDPRSRRRLSAVADDLAARLGGKAMAEATLHLTLAFVGAVRTDRLPDLLAAADEVAQATVAARDAVVLDRLHCRPAAKMLWAIGESCPPSLAALADRLQRGLLARGFSLDLRPFVAHVTLVRRISATPQAGDLDALEQAPVRWPVHDFVLLRSRPGARASAYERLGTWELASGR